MASLLRAYTSALQKSPYTTQSLTAFSLFAAGDVLAQTISPNKDGKHDFVRTLRLAGYGGIIFAPVVTRWYSMLQTISMKSKPALLVTRVGLDQFVLTPILVATFFSTQALLEGKSFSDAKERVMTQWEPTLYKNWGLFIPVQLANFSIVPVNFRILFVNVVSLFWNAYLSYANSASSIDETDEGKKELEVVIA